jgi:hypothetical protein
MKTIQLMSANRINPVTHKVTTMLERVKGIGREDSPELR